MLELESRSPVFSKLFLLSLCLTCENVSAFPKISKMKPWVTKYMHYKKNNLAYVGNFWNVLWIVSYCETGPQHFRVGKNTSSTPAHVRRQWTCLISILALSSLTSSLFLNSLQRSCYIWRSHENVAETTTWRTVLRIFKFIHCSFASMIPNSFIQPMRPIKLYL